MSIILLQQYIAICKILLSPLLYFTFLYFAKSIRNILYSRLLMHVSCLCHGCEWICYFVWDVLHVLQQVPVNANIVNPPKRLKWVFSTCPPAWVKSTLFTLFLDFCGEDVGMLWQLMSQGYGKTTWLEETNVDCW